MDVDGWITHLSHLQRVISEPQHITFSALNALKVVWMERCQAVSILRGCRSALGLVQVVFPHVLMECQSPRHRPRDLEMLNTKSAFSKDSFATEQRVIRK